MFIVILPSSWYHMVPHILPNGKMVSHILPKLEKICLGFEGIVALEKIVDDTDIFS